MAKNKDDGTNKQPIKIIGNIPAVVADGHGIAVNDENGSTNLMFIQIAAANEVSSEREASVVSNVRLGFEQLKSLSETLSQVVKDYESKSTKQ